MWVIARILSPKKSLRGTLANLIWNWRLILEISHSIESCTPGFSFLELESSIFAGYVFVMNLSKMSIALDCLLYESSNVTSSNLVLHSMLIEYFSQVHVFLQRLTEMLGLTQERTHSSAQSLKRVANNLSIVSTEQYGGAELGADRNICVRHSS